MNYNQTKFFSKIMWVFYLLIGLSGIKYVSQQQYKQPIIQTSTSQSQNTFFEVFDIEDVSTDEEISNNKQSYLYKVEIVEELNNSQYNKIIKDIETKTKKEINNDFDLNNIEVKFYIGQEEVYNHNIN